MTEMGSAQELRDKIGNIKAAGENLRYDLPTEAIHKLGFAAVRENLDTALTALSGQAAATWTADEACTSIMTNMEETVIDPVASIAIDSNAASIEEALVRSERALDELRWARSSLATRFDKIASACKKIVELIESLSDGEDTDKKATLGSVEESRKLMLRFGEPLDEYLRRA